MNQEERRRLFEQARKGMVLDQILPLIPKSPVASDFVKLHIVYDREGWAYHKRSVALQKNAPLNYQTTIGPTLPKEPVDIVFNLKYGSVVGIRSKINEKMPQAFLVTSYNAGWGRNDDLGKSILERSDHVILNNQNRYDNMLKAWPTCGDRMTHISNGVDLKVFKPKSNIVTRPPRVLWIGSKVHSELKNYPLVSGLKDRLSVHGLELDAQLVDSHNPTFNTEQIVDWYNGGVIFVVASRNEGTPNPALEAAGCGLALVTTRVGNMPELIEDRVNGVFVDENSDSIFEGIMYAYEHKERLSQAVLNSIQSWDWEERSKQFYRLFDRLVRTSQ